jgi:tetratricopeptide (TPR) repeat protein
MNPTRFFSELKRRNVYRVAAACGVVAWLLVQIATQVFPFLEIPNWAIRLVIMLVVIGFPIALVIAWVFEATPQGIVFAVQDEITRSIVDALKIKLALAPPACAQQNTEAYDLYLQGLYLSNKSDEESLRKSLTLFQRALDIDPSFARAWTGIAKAWYRLADAYVKTSRGISKS